MLDTSLFRSKSRGLNAVWLVNLEASSALPDELCAVAREVARES